MNDEKPRGGDRIQKILARAGVSSRREAETLITDGRVTVNGQPAELGQKADPEHDSIKLDGKRILLPKEHRYLLLNKPRGVMTTVADPAGRPTVIDLVPPALRKALVPVGRLDFLTEGLILLTDDGDFANRVAHPRYGCRKTYEVKVSGRPAERDLDRLREGIVLDGERTAPCRIEQRTVSRPKGVDSDNTWWNVELSQGRTRQIREMFQRIGHPVGKLRRVAIGGLTDPNLPLGSIRELTAREVEMLRQGSRTSDPLPSATSGRVRKMAGTSERFPEIRRWRAKGEEKAADAPRPPRAPRPARPEDPERTERTQGTARTARTERPEKPERPAAPERVTRTLLLPRVEEVRPAAPRRAGTATTTPGEERGGRPAPRPPRSVPRLPSESAPRPGFDRERGGPPTGRPVRSPHATRAPRAAGGIPGAPRPRSGPYPPPGADWEERGKPEGRSTARPTGRPAGRSGGPGARPAGRSTGRPPERSGAGASPGRRSDRPVRPPSDRPGAKPSGRPTSGRPPGRPSSGPTGRPAGRPTSARPSAGRPASGRPSSGRPAGRPVDRPTSGRPSGRPPGRSGGAGRTGGKPGGRSGR
ncbi:MAG TPA: pseudouridine synthase [Thermoanaerobaculia bacterium]|jgi:23S rRNA pseudouridine2605 synthase|nr:pseudouridine synthase [Thermoanaerobaculia bacterium]